MTGLVFRLASVLKSWASAPRPIVRSALIAVLALALPSLANGQIEPADQSAGDIDTAGLVIEATLGWDGTVDQSTPIPVSFLIRNSSDRIIEGHLTLSDRMSGHEVPLGKIIVAPGTARRLTSIQDMTNWYECFATLHGGERVLWRRELALSTGKQFFANVKFVLFIDDGGRKLQLPGAVSNTAAIASTELVVAGEQDRPIQCLTVKPWQVPNHPGPLVAAQAMIFREGAAVANLNRVQWRAVADWMCQGGTVFVHNKSSEIIERLTLSSPLGAEAAVQSDEFTVRHIGLDAIYEYPRPLFASEGTETRQLIAERIANLKKNHISTLVDAGHVYRQRGGRADMNRLLVIGFFGFYTILSGVVALLLFRLSRRRIGIYTVIVVVGASILSGLLGGMLRFSQGDLQWVTVTQAGVGGVVQVAKIDVQSAGGRNTQVAIQGEHPDLQFVGRGPRYYSWDRGQTGYAPFTWQPNLAIGEENTYQINVPMTPWGRRRLHATAYKRELRRMEVKLEFESHDPPSDNTPEPAATSGMPSGTFSLKLVNHLPFDVSECWLIIGATRKMSVQAISALVASGRSGRYGRYGRWQQAAITVSADGLIDVYHMQLLQVLSAGASYEDTFEAQFQVIGNNWDLARSWPGGSLTPPRISRMGTASAWIIGRIENSPSMLIDEQRSDFVRQNQLHLFVQEILPMDMPDASVFLGSGEGAATESAVDAPR